MASHNSNNHVANDLHIGNQIIPPDHLKSQQYFNEIGKWAKSMKMELNKEKTKCMVLTAQKN